MQLGVVAAGGAHSLLHMSAPGGSKRRLIQYSYVCEKNSWLVNQWLPQAWYLRR